MLRLCQEAVKEGQATLDLAILKKYSDLSKSDVMDIVLDDKWRDAVCGRVNSQVNSLTLALVARIQELGDRYAETLGVLDTT